MLEILAVCVFIFFTADFLDRCVKRKINDTISVILKRLQQQIVDLAERVDELENNQGDK